MMLGCMGWWRWPRNCGDRIGWIGPIRRIHGRCLRAARPRIGAVLTGDAEMNGGVWERRLELSAFKFGGAFFREGFHGFF